MEQMGRPKGSKNKNPYPKSEKVLARIVKSTELLRSKPRTHWIGRKHTAESKAKMSEAKRGKPLSEAQLKQVRHNALTRIGKPGKKHTAESKAKIGETRKRRLLIGEIVHPKGMLGKKHSENTKQLLHEIGIKRVEEVGIKEFCVMSKRYFQGKFRPHNPKKYAGNPNNIIYRSGWELRYMLMLDHDPNVLQWASEEIFIPYYSPIDKKKHRYFVDFIVKKKTPDGVKIFMIEIKPLAQTKAPKKTKNRRRTIDEAATFEVNQAKWSAAYNYCQKKGMIFQILTEKELGI